MSICHPASINSPVRGISQKAHDESERLQRQSSLLLSMATLMGTQFRQQSAKERTRFWMSVRAVAVGVFIPVLLCWMTGFSSVTHRLRLMQQSLQQFNQQHTVFLPSTTDQYKNYAVRPLSLHLAQRLRLVRRVARMRHPASTTDVTILHTCEREVHERAYVLMVVYESHKHVKQSNVSLHV